MTPAIHAAETGIRRAAVIGAGAMGSGIAAQFSNAGIPVELLDIPGEDGGHGPAQKGIDRQLKIGGFMVPEAAGLVRPGTLRDDLVRLSDCDWVIEAVIEDLGIKRSLFASVAPHLRPGAVLSSNTSTIPRAALIQGMEPQLASRFAITHFFNPPRVMELLEIVADDPALSAHLARAAQVLLGKTVIECRDTPGFIANRIGCFWMAVAAMEARRLGLSVETADAVHAALGIPRTGVFGLFDLVGIDLVPHVWGSLIAALPEEDAFHKFNLPADPLFRQMVAEGRFGRKAGAGFYRKGADGAREALDLETQTYRPVQPPADIPARDPRALIALPGVVGDYARSVLSTVAEYARTHAAAIAAEAGAIDTAMELGYSWRQGPLALASRAGLAAEAAAPSIRRRPPLAQNPVIIGNAQASLHDLGDGVACFRAHSKMNTFATEVVDLLEATVARAGRDFTALVLGNEDRRAFSAGADLGFFCALLEQADGVEAVVRFVTRGQALLVALREAPVPVVAAVHGFTLGGGCEFQMHADATIAHAESAIGVPETGVGLLPGWGGCTRLLARAHEADPQAPAVAMAARAFDTIMPGRISGSAAEAKVLGLLRPGDGIAMHRDLLIGAAKARALAMREGYAPPVAGVLPVAGPAGREKLLEPYAARLAAGEITRTDYDLAATIATVLTGGPEGDPATPLPESAFMALERAALRELLHRPGTRARMDHMLATGKRLRN